MKAEAKLRRRFERLDASMTPQQRARIKAAGEAALGGLRLGSLRPVDSVALLRLLGSRVVPAATSLAAARMHLENFDKTANPLFALAAIGDWPEGKPLPADLHRYLQDAAREIGHLGYEFALGRLREKDAPRRVLEAMGLGGRPGAANAFTDFRDYLRDLCIAEAYDAAMAAGAEKADEVADRLAEEYRVSRSQVYRSVRKVRQAEGTRRRSRDVRTRMKARISRK
jgi:hypothetical protein